MSSKIQIANMAISEVNGHQIASLTEDSAEAEAIELSYQPILEATLAQHPWAFASEIKTIALLDEDAYDFNYVYALPPDCLQPQGTIYTGDEQPEFIVRGRKFYYDFSPCVLKYTKKIIDTGLFSANFVTSFALALAADIAPRLGAAKLHQILLQRAGAAIRTAKATDAKTSNLRSKMNRTFVTVRK